MAEYDATTGAPINSSFITNSEYGPMALFGNELFLSGSNGSTTVSEYDATTGALINPSFMTGLLDPTSMAVSGSDLYVANYNSIAEYNAVTGATINSSLVTGISATGVAILGNILYVARRASVSEYDATTGALINATFITGLYPVSQSVAISGSDLYVVGNGAYVGLYDATTGDPLNPYVLGGNDGGGIAISGSNVYLK